MTERQKTQFRFYKEAINKRLIKKHRGKKHKILGFTKRQSTRQSKIDYKKEATTRQYFFIETLCSNQRNCFLKSLTIAIAYH